MNHYSTIEERRAYGRGFRRGRQVERRIFLLLMVFFGFLLAVLVHFLRY